MADQFFHLSDELFYQDFEIFGTHVSIAGFADISCGLAGDDTHVDDLGSFEGDVLLMGNGQAFGPMLQDLSTRFTSATTVELILDEPFGEGDRYLNEDREKLFDRDLEKWLREMF